MVKKRRSRVRNSNGCHEMRKGTFRDINSNFEWMSPVRPARRRLLRSVQVKHSLPLSFFFPLVYRTFFDVRSRLNFNFPSSWQSGSNTTMNILGFLTGTWDAFDEWVRRSTNSRRRDWSWSPVTWRRTWSWEGFRTSLTLERWLVETTEVIHDTMLTLDRRSVNRLWEDPESQNPHLTGRQISSSKAFWTSLWRVVCFYWHSKISVVQSNRPLPDLGRGTLTRGRRQNSRTRMRNPVIVSSMKVRSSVGFRPRQGSGRKRQRTGWSWKDSQSSVNQ